MRFASAAGLVIAVLLTGTAARQPSAAAPADDVLKGLTAFNIVVDVTESACGPSEDDVKTSIKYVLAGSPVRTSPTADSSLYVNVVYLKDCSAAHISFGVETDARVLDTHAIAIDATIWGGQTNGTLLSGSDDMSNRILEVVETQTKQFVVAWSAENPSH
jgi:hypothetical protein